MRKTVAALLLLGCLLRPGASFANEFKFTVLNKLGLDIKEVSISRPGAEKWGANILTAGVLTNGASAAVTYSTAETSGSWDLRILTGEDLYQQWDQQKLEGVKLVTLYVFDGNAAIKLSPLPAKTIVPPRPK